MWEFLIENCFGMQIDIQTLQPDGEILGETIFIDGEREVFGGKNGTTPERLRVKSGNDAADAFMYDNMVIRARFYTSPRAWSLDHAPEVLQRL